MTTRRGFLGTTLAGAASAANRATVERKIGGTLTKEDLPTPSMVVDLDIFERNLKHMAESTKNGGISVRPHVKIHKCPEVSKRQAALGSIGVSCATIAESELMHDSGIQGILWTCQPAGRHKIGRAVALAKKAPTFIVVVDDPITVDHLDEAAGAAHTKMNVIVDTFVGLARQGVQQGDKALALAQKVDRSRNLKLRGLMGYSGSASHFHGFEERRLYSASALAPMQETRDLCRKSGLNTEILTGGSTGTYNIDKANGLTELQSGSYIFMDTIYCKVGGQNNKHVYDDFGASLTVLTTVVSKTRDGMAAIDCGNKALLRPTDEVKGMPDVKVENAGAEYGMLYFREGARDIKLGSRVELYPSNLDMSTNVYDKYYIAKGDRIVDAWPIMGRAGAAQR
ncbi:MAG: alanine racemase [Bryobacteraceae bacterium]